MSLILSGTDGLSDVDGTAAAPAIRGTDTNTGIFFPAADTIAFAEGGVESMRLDPPGNLGLGVTPSAWSGFKSLESTAGNSVYFGSTQASLGSNAYNDGAGWKYKTTAPAGLFTNVQGAYTWYTAPSGTAGNAISFTQAMTLDASGNLLVGTTTAGGKFTVNSGTSFGGVWTAASNAGTYYYHSFVAGSTTTGTIVSTNGTNTSYNTSSDYRLKENIQPMTGALAKIAALKPCTYKWKADGSDGEGFIAHELQAVVPQCVTGEKDAVDADGKPVYQGIDTSFLVATMTAAIQEQQAIITALTARVAALEGTQQ